MVAGIPPYVVEGIVHEIYIALPRIICAHEANVRGTGQHLRASVALEGHLVYES